MTRRSSTSPSPAVDAALLRAARRGDRVAREQVVAAEIGLVRSLAFRYRGMGVPIEDLVQEGALGLLDAIDRHDPTRGVDFEPYARFRICRAIRNALSEQARLVRLPKQVVERRRALDRAEARLVAAGLRPTVADLAAETGLSTHDVVEARAVSPSPISLDAPLLPDGSTAAMLIADPAAVDPELQVISHEEAELVDEAVARLPARQREVVSRHFGLGRAAETIGAVAGSLHLSPHRTRTIEHDALYSLRDQFEPRAASDSGEGELRSFR